MEIKELLNLSRNKLVILRKALRQNNFRIIKASIYDFILIINDLRREIFNEKDETLAKLIKDPIYMELQDFYNRDLKPLVEQNFIEDPETYTALFQDFLEPLLSKIDENLVVIVSFFVPTSNVKIVYLKSYLSAKSKNTYQENIKIINRTERRIVNYLGNGGIIGKNDLTLKCQGKHKGKLHAHLSDPIGNHRILYSYNDKTIFFEDLGTHKELDLGDF